jgi:ribose transport system permease protein
MALTGERVPEFTSIYTGNLLFIPNPLLIWMIVAIILGGALRYTKYGSYTYAVGGNEIAAKYTGISADKIKITAYTITGFCAGLAALLDFSRNAAISVTGAGHMYEFHAITAAVIGGTALSGGRGKIINAFFGVIIISTVSNMMIMFGISPYLAGFVNGLIIMLAVLLQRREKASL